MKVFHFGSFTTSLLAMAIPALAVLLLWLNVYLRRDSYRRRFQGWRLVWEMWGSTVLLSLVAFGVFYWYLFWRPFYTVTLQPDGAWTLTYVLPTRDVRMAPSDIAALAVQDERLPILRTRRLWQYLVVELRDGRAFFSAPLDRDEAGRLLQQLRAHLP